MAKILIVEDEKPIAEGIQFNLEKKGHDVALALDGAAGFAAVQKHEPDLVILDVRLPKLNGFEVCQKLRDAKNYVPILMLTARDQPDDVVFGLKAGADDYMTKPFDLAELLARAEGLLRRQGWSEQKEQISDTSRWEFGKYWVDFKSYQAKTEQGVVALSRKELKVMELFRSKVNQVVTREELLEKVWQLPNHPNTRVVDNVIVALRKYFEKDSQNSERILSIRGTGYRFVNE